MSGLCETCGAALGEGANFCAACGTKVQPGPTPGDPRAAAEPPDEPSAAGPSTPEPVAARAAAYLPGPPSPAAGSGSTPPPQPVARKRRSRKRWLYVIAAVIAVPIAIGIIVAAATGSKNATAPTSPVVHNCSFYPNTKKKPETCTTSSGPCWEFPLADKPAACLSVAQLSAQKQAKKRAAAQARAEARAVKKRAAAAAAAQAAANAWHSGYHEQSGSVFWKWKDTATCQEFAQYGCWHVVVITKYGCPSYVAVNANEYQHGAIIGQLLDNQSYGIPPKTPRVFELDADTGANVTAGDVSIDCE